MKMNLLGKKILKVLTVIIMVVAVFTVTPEAFAEYFKKPIKIIVPFSPGGGTDTMSRYIQTVLMKEKIVKVPVVVQNMPGGSGARGYDYVEVNKVTRIRLLL